MTTTETTFATLTVPAKFFLDHDKRACVQDTPAEPAWSCKNCGYQHPAYVLKHTGNRVTVNLHPLDVDDLLSDAIYYADDLDLGEDFRGLVASARATAVAMMKVGVTPHHRWSRDAARILARHNAAAARAARTKARKAAR
jgi:hypothetical protein